MRILRVAKATFAQKIKKLGSDKTGTAAKNCGGAGVLLKQFIDWRDLRFPEL